MRLLVQHQSRYRYPRPAALGPHTIRLRPAQHAKARIEAYGLTVAQPCHLRWQQDPSGNHVARVTFADGVRIDSFDVKVELASRIIPAPVNPFFDFFIDDRAEHFPFTYPAETRRDLEPFLDRIGSVVRGRAAPRRLRRRAAPRRAHGAAGRRVQRGDVNKRVRYVTIREESGHLGARVDAGRGPGELPGFGGLVGRALRASLGSRQRFVSGCRPGAAHRRGMIPDAPRGGVGRDVVDLHAWAGGVPARGRPMGRASTRPAACSPARVTSPSRAPRTRQFAAPVDGTSDVPAEAVTFSMVVGRLGHEPRPTTPYEEPVWEALLAAGDAADAKLAALGVRLTMGGEPTFCARDGAHLPEWLVDALGKDKWTRGLALSPRAAGAPQPGGAGLHRAGKHYPGESLPRWALDVRRPRRRQAGVGETSPPTQGSAGASLRRRAPRGRGPGRAASGSPASSSRPSRTRCGASRKTRPTSPPASTRSTPTSTIRRIVAASPACSAAASGARWASSSPSPARASNAAGAIPRRPRSAPPAGRASAGRFGAGTSSCSPATAPSASGSRCARCAPGWSSTSRRRRPPLPIRAASRRRRRRSSAPSSPPLSPARATSRHLPTRSAPRSPSRRGTSPPVVPAARLRGRLLRPRRRGSTRCAASSPSTCCWRATLPRPRPCCAASRSRPTRACSRSTSPRPRARAPTWRSSKSAFDAAPHHGLHAEKYQVDGRMAGSGGGNHLTLGGPTPLTSPFLRRPDLLASLITFVQHHPSLSYLFTGLFVGPTSQAPRLDEARDGALYEAEIALRHAHAVTAGGAGAAAGESSAAVARGHAVPPPARRRDRQHPPRRDLHRQALRARRAVEPAGPRRAARLRDAAARADGLGADDPRAGAPGGVRGRAAPPAAGAPRADPPRSLPAPVLDVARLRGGARLPGRARAAAPGF